jgi:threonine dehydrogenase-like Zn-dependent dehydrogenase
MRAFMVYEAGIYEVTDIPLPSIRDDELLVKVGAASICHSDIDILIGVRKHAVRYPNILGHEFAGTIVDMGEGVSGFCLGDTITSECMVWCGSCRQCSLGNRAQCLYYDELGTMRNGGFAEYVAVPSKLAHKFTKISMEEAATAECAGNAYNAVDAAGIMPGDVVLVVGPGPIGLFAIQFAKLKFPSQVIAVGTRDKRLDLAKEMGASSTINIHKEDAFKRILELTDGKGVDVVLQCATTDSAFELAVQAAGAHARIIIEGFSNSKKGILLDFNQFILKPMMIKGLTGADGYHIECVLRLMEQGLVTPKNIISHIMPLENIIEGFGLLMSRDDNAVKVVIQPFQ